VLWPAMDGVGCFFFFEQKEIFITYAHFTESSVKGATLFAEKMA
jgi:hypothetical protein